MCEQSNKMNVLNANSVVQLKMAKMVCFMSYVFYHD